MKNLSATDIPRPSRPSRCIPGMSQAKIAANMQESADEVARIERQAMAHFRAGLAKKGVTWADIVPVLGNRRFWNELFR